MKTVNYIALAFIVTILAAAFGVSEWQDRVRVERPCDVLWNKPYVCRHGAKNEDFQRAPNDYRGI